MSGRKLTKAEKAAKPDYTGGYRQAQAAASEIARLAGLAEVDFTRRALCDKIAKEIDELNPGENK